MTDVCAIPAFRDNYIWLLVGEGAPPPVVLVDPGDAAPVLAALRHLDLRPTTLFITHHHSDHVGGVAALCDAFPLDVYGPANETIPRRRHALCDGDRDALPRLPANPVLAVPGRTPGHIATNGRGGGPWRSIDQSRCRDLRHCAWLDRQLAGRKLPRARAVGSLVMKAGAQHD